MSYSSMAVRFFTAPKPLGDAMDSDTFQSAAPRSQGYTVVKSNAGSAQLQGTELLPPKKQGLTFSNQASLPKLPIPDLEETCRRHLDALTALQTPREHEDTKAAVATFLNTDGTILQERLKEYASLKTSYIEQFCESSLLSPFPSERSREQANALIRV